MRSSGRTFRQLFGNAAVAFQTHLPDLGTFEHFRIRRAVRRMTGAAAFNFQRPVFKDEWPLFVGVTFNAGRIRPDRQIRLFVLKSAVGIMTIAAFDGAFHNFVMKRLTEL